MARYDDSFSDIPAPFANVAVRDYISGDTVSDIPLLIDTGADVTILPRSYIEKFNIGLLTVGFMETESYGGTQITSPVVRVQMLFLNKKFGGEFMLTDNSWGILGRNILNQVVLLFNGPARSWQEVKSGRTQ